MANLNKVMLLGNLTRDPEIRFTPKGTAVGELGLAVNRRVSDGNGNWSDEVTFVDVTVWGHQAENAEKYLKKGRGVLIEGRLQLDTWDDKESGQKRSKLKVVAESVQYLMDSKVAESSARARETATERKEREAREGGGNSAPAPGMSDDLDQQGPGEEDDIPF